MKQNFKFLVSIFVVTPILLLGFQNCNRIHVTDVSSKEILKSSNNGGSYEGKITENYYRFVPDFTCQQTPAPLAYIAVSSPEIFLTFNQNQLCAASTQQLSPQSIDSSIYQPELIGYLDGIYQFKQLAPLVVPAKIVEFWCRDRNDELGVETVTTYDSTDQKSVTKIYYATLNTAGTYSKKVIPEFTVASASVSPIKQVINNGQGFELLVFFDQPSITLPGLYRGRIQSIIEGQYTQREALCRLGGRFDSRK